MGDFLRALRQGEYGCVAGGLCMYLFDVMFRDMVIRSCPPPRDHNWDEGLCILPSCVTSSRVYYFIREQNARYEDIAPRLRLMCSPCVIRLCGTSRSRSSLYNIHVLLRKIHPIILLRPLIEALDPIFVVCYSIKILLTAVGVI